MLSHALSFSSTVDTVTVIISLQFHSPSLPINHTVTQSHSHTATQRQSPWPHPVWSEGVLQCQALRFIAASEHHSTPALWNTTQRRKTHHITSHHITSHHTTPHHITSQHNNTTHTAHSTHSHSRSHHITSHHITSHNTQYTIHNTQYIIHNTQYTIHNTQYTIHNTHCNIANHCEHCDRFFSNSVCASSHQRHHPFHSIVARHRKFKIIFKLFSAFLKMFSIADVIMRNDLWSVSRLSYQSSVILSYSVNGLEWVIFEHSSRAPLSMCIFNHKTSRGLWNNMNMQNELLFFSPFREIFHQMQKY